MSTDLTAACAPPSLASSLSKFGPLKKSTVLLLLEHEHVVAQVYKMAEERGAISDADVLVEISKHTGLPEATKRTGPTVQTKSNPMSKFDSLKTSTKLLLFDNEHVLGEVYEEAKRRGTITDDQVLAIVRQRSVSSTVLP